MSAFRGFRAGLVLLVMGAALMPVAHAQFAVIDVASVTQLIMQVKTLEEQLMTAKDQLMQVKQAYDSTTGGRGMENLLSSTARNYLPGDWSTLQSVLQGTSGSFGALSADVTRALGMNAVLSSAQLALLAPAVSQQVQAQRQTAALLEAIAHQGLANASSRFSSLQQLITAIGSAGDQKAVLDLQARITAEQAMLQNESTKLALLYQSSQAQRWVDEQRSRELAVAGVGDFAARFQPTP